MKVNIFFISCSSIMGLISFFNWIYDYPTIPAKKFKKDNDKTQYRKYRKEAYLRYVMYFIVPPILLFAMALISEFFPFAFLRISGNNCLFFVFSMALLVNYYLLFGRYGYSDDATIWCFATPSKYRFVKRLKKEDRAHFVLAAVIFNIFPVIALFLFAVN